MKINPRALKSIIDNEARDYAMYTIQERAIPSIMDGLKPVQRFVMYSALLNATKDYKKVAAVANVISEFGYNHAETAAQNACALMSNTWSNNYGILLGRGNFGSRIVKDAAQPRYIFTKVHENFYKMFKDNDILPKHEKEEHIPPKHYLPVAPFVLMNGISGIATGYGTKILPHCPESVIDCVKQVVETGKCDEPKIKFPDFVGKIDTSGPKWFLEGLYELVGKTKLIITEIPPKYDRLKYVTLLDKLVESEKIVSYTEQKGNNNFCFHITLKRDFVSDHENIIKVFKLRQGISQNLNVIMPNGDVKNYKTASDLIVDFVALRSPYLQTRIDVQIKKTKASYDMALAKVDFIKKVRDKTIVFENKTRKAIVAEIETYENLKDYSVDLVSMNLYHMTEDEIKKLEDNAKVILKEHEYWKSTSIKKQYIKDIKEIK